MSTSSAATGRTTEGKIMGRFGKLSSKNTFTGRRKIIPRKTSKWSCQ